MSAEPPKPRRWALFARRTVVLPTRLGLLLILLVVGLIGWTGLRFLHPFLAIEERFREGSVDLLCVEGWAAPHVMEAAAEEFATGRYGRVAVIGGHTGSRETLLGFPTYAELGADLLRRSGIEDDRILVAIPEMRVARRRTFHDAMTLKTLLEERGLRPERLFVISSGVHARRTTMAFRRVFAGETEVKGRGVAPRDYDAARWWASSNGCKVVIMEWISWIYEALRPGRAPREV